MIFKTSDNVNLFFKSNGNGIPCIFIHGGPGGWSKDFELGCGQFLEKDFKMIYLDQRGCGRSGGSKDDDYSINRIVKDLDELRVYLNLDKWIMMCHSFGGIIATDYASKYQMNLKGLILINCSLFIGDSEISQREKGIELLNLDEDAIKKVKSESLNNFITRLAANDLHYKLQCKEKKTYDYIIELSKDIKNINMALQRDSREDYFKCYYDTSNDVFVKTLIIVGNEDYCIGLNHHKNFKFKNSYIEIIEGKHVPYLENSKELVSKIKRFVQII